MVLYRVTLEVMEDAVVEAQHRVRQEVQHLMILLKGMMAAPLTLELAVAEAAQVRLARIPLLEEMWEQPVALASIQILLGLL